MAQGSGSHPGGVDAAAAKQYDTPELTALFLRAQKGDENAFAMLVDRYEKLVYNLAYQYTENAEDAADVSQDAFLKLWRSLPSFRQESSLSTWVFRITQNCALDALRKRNVRRTVSLTVEEDDGEEQGREMDLADPNPDHDPAARSERKERTAAVREAISALHADHREILVLRDMQGYSYAEIGEMLGLEPGTVKSRINRARMQVKEFLQSRNFF